MEKTQSAKAGLHDGSENEDDTQDTYFVDATQFEMHIDDRELDGECASKVIPDKQLNMTEIEKQNKAFLDQSWANIATNEEAEKRILDEMDATDLPETHNNEVYQIVQRSKSKRKSPTRSYLTRGKTGQKKIFK